VPPKNERTPAASATATKIPSSRVSGRSFGIRVFVSNLDQRASPEKQRASARRRAESAAIRINLFRDSFRLSRASEISIEQFVGD
jgi:hypothetical protein